MSAQLIELFADTVWIAVISREKEYDDPFPKIEKETKQLGFPYGPFYQRVCLEKWMKKQMMLS